MSAEESLGPPYLEGNVREDGYAFFGNFTVIVGRGEGTLIARWDTKTGEMTLERAEDGAIVLASRDPDAFHAGVELLRPGRMITWLGFVLTPNRIDCVARQVP